MSDDLRSTLSDSAGFTIRLRSVLLLGSLLLASTVAGAQRSGSATASSSGGSAADALEDQAAARVADAVCSKRIVLLGELPEHGEARGMGVKARVVQRLVDRCGFNAVLFEAGNYDFFGLERAIAATTNAAVSAGSSDSLETALARAMGGLWWTRELAPWRRWLVRQAMAGRVKLGGIDDQLSATAAYARATLPGLVGTALPTARAAECREAVTRYLGWSYTATLPYDNAEQARLADCTQSAANRASSAGTSAERRTPDQVMLGNLASFFARERGGADRDLVMAQNVAWWSARLPRDAKIVVWTATVHAARAPGAHPMLPRDVLPMGERLAARWGDHVAVIGFTALQGQWARAGQPTKPLAPLPTQALEARVLGAKEWAYLDRAALRSLGALPSRLFGSDKLVTNDWSAAFDGVLVIRDEAAPTFESRR